MTHKHILRWSLVALSILIILGYWLVPRFWPFYVGPDDTSPQTSTRVGAKTIPVEVYVAQKEQVLDGIRAVGSLVANEQVELASEISGKVVQVLFTEGTAVQKGQVLVRINDDDLQAQLKRYQFQEKTLSEKLNRQRILFEKEAISRETFDQVQTEYNVLLADMDILKIKIDRSQIKAPFSGVIGFRYVSQGSYIQPNSRIAMLVDYATLKVEFAVPEKYVNINMVGHGCFFTTESNPKAQRAMIYAMEPKVEENTRSIVLRATYNNASGRLRPGMSARVTIPMSQNAEVLMVPTEAIIPSISGKSVWLVRGGKLEQQQVETGTRQEAKIEVLKGLAIGDSVIITGLMQLREGAAIKVTN
ncbi:MAG: efflux RND transporter periplasmic adaptor subunit [Mucinivorans sp.]